MIGWAMPKRVKFTVAGELQPVVHRRQTPAAGGLRSVNPLPVQPRRHHTAQVRRLAWNGRAQGLPAIPGWVRRARNIGHSNRFYKDIPCATVTC